MNKFGPFYAKSSDGKIKIWMIEVISSTENTETASIKVTHGYEDGKLTSSTKQVKRKNIGKSNETTAIEQAIAEVNSKIKSKKDEGYVSVKEQLDNYILTLPMLAHTFKKRSHNITYPAYVQPKLNGVRCLGTKDKYLSRKGTTYNLPHLDKVKSELLNKLNVHALDGEIFKTEWTFQEIIRNVKKARTTTNQLQYWIYDLVDCNSDFEDRYKALLSAFNCTKKFDSLDTSVCIDNFVLVPTIKVNSEKEVMQWQTKFTEAGFEGTIIRNAKGKYVPLHKSENLQKYKDMLDNEYKIIGAHEATGDDEGTAVFELETKEGLKFSARPKGSRELRKEYLDNIDSIIGLYATIVYQELSEPPEGYTEGVPIFPVLLAIRDYE